MLLEARSLHSRNPPEKPLQAVNVLLSSGCPLRGLRASAGPKHALLAPRWQVLSDDHFSRVCHPGGFAKGGVGEGSSACVQATRQRLQEPVGILVRRGFPIARLTIWRHAATGVRMELRRWDPRDCTNLQIKF